MNNLLSEDLGSVNLPEKRTPTAEQALIIDSQVEPGEVLKVRAYAGTGKTTTFIDFADAHPEAELTYLAFNKSVADEAKRKFPSNTLVKTQHALAWAVTGRKYKDIRGSVPMWQVAWAFRVAYYEATLVCKTLENFLNSADLAITEDHVEPDHLDRMQPGYEGRIIDAVEVVWDWMQNEKNQFQMTHSGYLKLYQLSMPTIPGDYILLDEAQDTNPVTLALVMSQARKNKRVLMCGDPYQQIYAWRGAIDSMQQVPGRELYLTQSWRFPEHIATVANIILKQFFDEKIPLVGRGKGCELDGKVTTISRTNSTIFHSVVPIVQQEQNYHVVGRDQWMMTLDLLKDAWCLMSNKRIEIQNRSISTHSDWKAYKEYAESTLDMEAQTRITIVEDYMDAVPGLVQKMRRHYNTDSESVPQRFVTCHKAKGLEWPAVTLASDYTELFNKDGKLKSVAPPGTERNDATIASDEVNLLYVAATRAKQKLVQTMDLKRLTKNDNSNISDGVDSSEGQ